MRCRSPLHSAEVYGIVLAHLQAAAVKPLSSTPGDLTEQMLKQLIQSKVEWDWSCLSFRKVDLLSTTQTTVAAAELVVAAAAARLQIVD